MILHIDHVSVWSIPLYAIFYFLGSLTSILLAYYCVRVSPHFRHIRYFDCVWIVWLSGVLGAKFFSLLLLPGSMWDAISHIRLSHILEGGYHLWGGVFTGILTLLFLGWRWRHEVEFWPTLHLLLLVALPGLAIGRVGCIFAGCCYGDLIHEGHFPLYFQYDRIVYPVSLSRGLRFPIQLLDSVGVSLLSVFVWIYTIKRQWKLYSFQDVGGLVAVVFIVFGLGRVGEDFFRDGLSRSDSPLWGVYFSGWAALSLALIGGIVGWTWLTRRTRQKRVQTDEI